MAIAAKADILERILVRKREEVAERKAATPFAEMKRRALSAPAPAGFFAAVRREIEAGRPAVIAELKKASPSRGLIRPDYDPRRLAESCCQGGATCLSVLTDEPFFEGRDQDLVEAKRAAGLPVLRKDFTLDPWQVYEARALGADCVLLIVTALSDPALRELATAAADAGVDVLVEVHDRTELERALMLRTPLIGMNNRDLRTFETDLNNTLNLLVDVFPDRTVVTESGIRSREDVALMRRHGVNAFLVGETLMRAPDPGAKLRELFLHGPEPEGT
ncbi:MAG: indole-3-glycerol phosphate synthase TrpC [Gammaproteobacteria bacterium]|nr:indole-3-glycerol phosphate synthase TrpC [Gammaproteobacteria bacterium]